MCTALSFKHFFGRNLDYEFSYGEQISIAPRNFNYGFRYENGLSSQYAIIGMAHVYEGYPLYYDAINEKGLGMAGLNFVGNAYFGKTKEGYSNVCAFEFIPWVLTQCENVSEAKELLEHTNICDTPFNEYFPVASLHYMIADSQSCIVLECMKDGMHVYDNPTGVLTNNPPFDKQLFNLNNYMYLSPSQPNNSFSKNFDLDTYSRGMGSIGLPGDVSSMSRFVKCVYTREHAQGEDITEFFHILHSVEQQKGLCEVEPGKFEYTIYSSGCDLDKGIYYYTTYHDHQIRGVNMHNEDLDGESVISYPMLDEENIYIQN